MRETLARVYGAARCLASELVGTVTYESEDSVAYILIAPYENDEIRAAADSLRGISGADVLVIDVNALA